MSSPTWNSTAKTYKIRTVIDRRDALVREFFDKREKVEMTYKLGRMLLDIGIINVDRGQMSREEEDKDSSPTKERI